MPKLNGMGLAAAVLVAALAPAAAQDVALPARRPGQWEIRTVTLKPDNGPKINAQACIDAATDRDLLEFGLRLTKENCTRYEITRKGQTWTIASECAMGGMKSRTRTRITGDFQSQLKIHMEGTLEGAPGGNGGPQETVLTQDNRWISAACTDGLVPGDVAVDGGMKINIRQMQQLQKLLPKLQIR